MREARGKLKLYLDLEMALGPDKQLEMEQIMKM